MIDPPRSVRPPAGALVLALSTVWGAPALAQVDINVCSFEPWNTSGEGCGQACDGTMHSTLGDALAVLEDLVEAYDGVPSTQLCAIWDEPREGAVTLDNGSQSYGSPFAIRFFGPASLCPAPTSSPETPVLTFANPGFGATFDEVEGLELDFGPSGSCATDPRPGVRVDGTGRLRLNRVRLIGTSTAAVHSTGPVVELVNSRIADCTGSAVWSVDLLRLAGTEVSGCLADERAVLDLSESDDNLTLENTTLFGNVALGSSGATALIDARLHSVRQSALIGNAVEGGIPLIRTWPADPLLSLEDGALSGLGTTISRSTFARNRHVAAGSLPTPSSTTTDLLPIGTVCAGMPAGGYGDLPAAGAGLPAADVALVNVTSESTGFPGPSLSISGSFFVENEFGSGPLFDVDATVGDMSFQLLQNTFAALPGRVVEFDAGPSAEIVVLRNLASATTGGSLVQIEGAPSLVSISMNVAPEGATWSLGSDAPASWIVGPNPILGDVEFLDEDAVAAGSPCDTFALVCPSAPPDSCGSWPLVGLPCPVDRAAAWVPSSALGERLPDPWPWDTEFFTTPEAGWEAPGATGGPCELGRGTWDRLDELAWGDGDLAPDALDCDNEDASVVPTVPEHDGFSSEFCDASDVACYTCPDGSEPPPSDDDDSGSDDDDSAASDDDDSEAVDDDDSGGSGGAVVWPAGCGASGCGFSWEPLALLPLAALGSLRRRRVS